MLVKYIQKCNSNMILFFGFIKIGTVKHAQKIFNPFLSKNFKFFYLQILTFETPRHLRYAPLGKIPLLTKRVGKKRVSGHLCLAWK